MKQFYIDLGTSNTTIYDKDEGVLLHQPSVISFLNGEVHAAGNEAKKMLGVSTLEFSFPVSEGVVKNCGDAVLLLREFLKTAKKPKKANATVLYPCGITKEDRQNLFDVVSECGFINVSMKESVLALNIDSKKAYMVIDMGGGKSDFAIIRSGEILGGCTLFSGGNNVEESIIKAFLDDFGLNISLVTAEKVKIGMGSLELLDQSTNLIDGKDFRTGAFRSVLAGASLVNIILKDFFDRIIKVIKVLKGQVMPQVAAEIQTGRIYIRGGVAKTFGIAEYFKKRLNIESVVMDKPQLFF